MWDIGKSSFQKFKNEWFSDSKQALLSITQFIYASEGVGPTLARRIINHVVAHLNEELQSYDLPE
jgi:hypothetical protein